jgi:hypothetical protein
MSRRLAVASALLVMLVPALAVPQPDRAIAPEAMLAEQSVLFVRFDGLEPHRKAYDQTAFANLMRGDCGRFIDYLGKFLSETLAEQLKELNAGGDVPPQLLKLQSALAYLPQLGEYFKQHGFCMGVEVIDLEQPRTHLTLVLPNAGERKTREAFYAVIQMIAQAAELKIKEAKIAGRTLNVVDGTDPVTVAYWQEGNHLVFSVGTEKPEHVLAVIDGKAKSVTANPLYKSVAGFERYETALRGYIDFARPIELVKAKIPPAAQIIKDFGLDGLKSVTIHSGFEGKYDRSTIALNLAKERTGVLRLMKPAGSIDASNLPPVPPDATSVTVAEFDCAGFYDVAIQTIESVMKLAAPNELPQFQQAIQMIDQVTGVNVRQDVLGSLGTGFATYNSPSEGLFFLGNGYVVQVKDKKRLEGALKKMCEAASQQTGMPVQLKKHEYHGQELTTLEVKFPGFFVAPTYAFHKDWMVMGLYPQVVQGFLARAGGKLPAWKPSETLAKALADAKRVPGAKITSLSETDPRPTVKFLLSIAPIGAALANSLLPSGFDVTMLPNAHMVCEPLFPNASLTLDDGESVRFESYASLSLPDLGPGIAFNLALGMVFGMRTGAVPAAPFPIPAQPVIPPAPVPVEKKPAPEKKPEAVKRLIELESKDVPKKPSRLEKK